MNLMSFVSNATRNRYNDELIAVPTWVSNSMTLCPIIGTAYLLRLLSMQAGTAITAAYWQHLNPEANAVAG